jgi:hypothetical protein
MRAMDFLSLWFLTRGQDRFPLVSGIPAVYIPIRGETIVNEIERKKERSIRKERKLMLCRQVQVTCFVAWHVLTVDLLVIACCKEQSSGQVASCADDSISGAR